MPVKTVPFFDRHAVDTPSSETAVDVIPKKRRRNRGKGKKKVPDQAKKPELEFTRMVDGKEVGNHANKFAAAKLMVPRFSMSWKRTGSLMFKIGTS